MRFDTGYITDYILNYDAGVPPIVIVGDCLLVCFIVLLLYQKKKSDSSFIRQASFCLLMGYIFLVLSTTILFREESDRMRYSLCPFGSYIKLYNKMLAQNILNIVLFMPIGFLAGAALRKKHILNVIKVGVSLSLFIEVTQLISRRGICNIDDVINNTLGCVIGFTIFVICYRIARRIA